MQYPLTVGGAYSKTACFVFDTYNQADADAYCKADGMVLLDIDSLEIQSELFAFLEPQMTGYQVAFRVDGIRESDVGNWYYYSYGKTLAFSGLDWLTTSDTLTGDDTMVITNMAYPMAKVIQTFKVDGLDKSLLFPIICEYKAPQ